MGGSVVALFLFVALFVTLGIWQVRGQVEYLRRYSNKTGERISLEDHVEAYSRNPLRGWLFSNAATWRGLSVTAKPQDDPELEKLRRAYLTRRRIWLVASALALVALGVYLNVLNQ